jgi:hypothetical protein
MIKASFNVIADMSGLDKFIKECIQLEKKQVSIGFDDTKHPDADMGMAELAWILETGSDKVNIPPRNFMDSTNYQFGVDNMKKAQAEQQEDKKPVRQQRQQKTVDKQD